MEEGIKGMGAREITFSKQTGGAERVDRVNSQEWGLWDGRAIVKGG